MGEKGRRPAEEEWEWEGGEEGKKGVAGLRRRNAREEGRRRGKRIASLRRSTMGKKSRERGWLVLIESGLIILKSV